MSAAVPYHPHLDPILEATVIEPFVEWLTRTQRKDRSWARQSAKPLRQLLKERPEDELLRVQPEVLGDVSAWAGATKANAKAGRLALRLYRIYRGVAP